ADEVTPCSHHARTARGWRRHDGQGRRHHRRLPGHRRRPGGRLRGGRRVNLTGFFWLTQRAIAEMASRYGGHVVNVTATLAEVAVSSTPAVLAALTKGGLAAATRSLAIEDASFGIRVNAVSPRIIQTPVHPAECYAALGDRVAPPGRAGKLSAVVDAVLFLESSPYIPGEILHIDGGQIAGH